MIYLHIRYTFSFIIRKKFKVLTKGTRVQKYLDYLAGCTLLGAQKSDPQINEGGDGYVDLSEYARDLEMDSMVIYTLIVLETPWWSLTQHWDLITEIHLWILTQTQ